MTIKKKYIKVFLFFLFVILIIGTIYYFRPQSANDVFELNDVEKINFNVRFDETKDSKFLNTEISGEDVDYFINLLELSKYQRVFGGTNIQSQTNAYDIVIVNKSNNYSIVINDRGYVVVEVSNNEKKYKILSSKSDTLIKLIDYMLMTQ
ncbi:hypothetical protein SAMN04488688_11070 [Paenibacillus sp. cl141a]|uniref:hypothetical protein n=1 Tax=Paenibacillus sp. cl141a TaxID=1761877 RepID=UPI0008B83DB8|nr:hypothetical protein [Paenibacillus sp. cl141a]SEM22825.1 hypothetical protein SAMN04488688_11070 [Paenibacillus sp. cl141a]